MAHKEITIDFRFEGAAFTVQVPCFYQGMIVKAGEKSVALHKQGNKFTATEISTSR